MVTSPNNVPRTVGELRASGHTERGVKEEIRENLLVALSQGDTPATVWPGIVGFDDTVLPQLERALIAGHDFVLLGERGQGKTRLLRALAGLLDEWTPVIAGAELLQKDFGIHADIWSVTSFTELSREAQDAYAVRSYERALAAAAAGHLAWEIAPVELPKGGVVAADEEPQRFDRAKLPIRTRGSATRSKKRGANR